MKVIILILLLALIIGLLNRNRLHPKEYFHTPKYIFLTHAETEKFFKDDQDDYLKKLTELDVRAQKSKSKADYQSKIIQSAIDFTIPQKSILLHAMKRADDKLKNIVINGFDGKKAARMNWKIALTKGNVYEEGLPHTRLDTIFISDTLFSLSPKQIAKTMLHEKVHVYSRQFPNDMKVWNMSNGFIPFRKWNTFKYARSNPDIDDWAYLSPNGKPMIVEYATSYPNSIHDVKYPDGHSYKTEHPNEALAYQLERYIN